VESSEQLNPSLKWWSSLFNLKAQQGPVHLSSIALHIDSTFAEQTVGAASVAGASDLDQMRKGVLSSPYWTYLSSTLSSPSNPLCRTLKHFAVEIKSGNEIWNGFVSNESEHIPGSAAALGIVDQGVASLWFGGLEEKLRLLQAEPGTPTSGGDFNSWPPASAVPLARVEVKRAGRTRKLTEIMSRLRDWGH
jgi:hypothetical protein